MRKTSVPASLSDVKTKSDEQELGSSRRQMLKTSATTGAFAATATFFARTAYSGGSDLLRVGLIGCGGRGRGAAVNAYNADEGVHITALGDMFPERISISSNVLRREMGTRFTANEDTSFTGIDAYKRVLESGIDVILLPPFPPRPSGSCHRRGGPRFL